MSAKETKPLHWSEEKEQTRSYLPLKILLILFKIFPSTLLRAIAYPVSFFYFIFSVRARTSAVEYQKQFINFTQGKIFTKPHAFRQILAFSLTLIEKTEGWAGKVTLKNVEFQNDDIKLLIQQLDEGKGALLICSHLGNAELLRSLANYNRTGVSHPISVSSVIDISTTQNFNRMLKEINPESMMNIISSNDIGPETIIQLSQEIDHGGLVVIAGDRTSANTRNRYLNQKFLGKTAQFAYGVYFLTALLNVPTYFVFALRKKPTGLFPRYTMYVHKSAVNFTCSRKERENRIEKLCKEFTEKLEKYCILYPFQWYNFYNFWALPEKNSKVRK
ncbi:MAG: hypothetical protein LKF96_05485 [Treponema sp.]|jgi:predicted LPLAT superfamily acyltransferase|nr:hypothetical protein [Treponema sp.]